MEEGLNSPPIKESQAPESYPKSRFLALFLAIILLVIAMAAARFEGHPASSKIPSADDYMQSDLTIKAYYGSRQLRSKLPTTNRKQMTSENRYFKRAISGYENAVKTYPRLYSLRRLIIVSPKDRAWAIGRYADYKAPDRHYANLAKTEAKMWRDIYLNTEPLSAQQARTYEKAIREQKLGWYQNLALGDMHLRAGMVEAAKKDHEAAKVAATTTIAVYMLLFFVFSVAGIAGLIFLIIYITRMAQGLKGAPTEADSMSPAERSVFAGHMLGVFLVYMLIAVVLSLGGSFIIHALVGKAHPSSRLQFALSEGTYFLWDGLAFAYLLYRLKARGWTLRTVGFRFDHPLREVLWGFAGYASCLPLLLVASLLSQHLSSRFPTPPNPVVPMFMQSTSLEKVLLFVMAAVMAPIFEELFFRGVLFNGLKTRWGLAAGVLLSSTIFALVHPLPLGFLPIFVLGSVFSVIFNQRGSLLPNMVAHALNNSVAFLILFLAS